jgi:cytochrome P450
MSLLLVGGLFFLTLVLAYHYSRRRYVRSINDPPGQKPQLLFGNLLQAGLLSGKVTFHEVMLDYQRRFGDTFLFWFGPNPCITFCTVEHAQAIFADRSTFDQSPLFLPNFDLLCPHSIFMPTGSKWKRHVRVMLPMFKRAKVIHHSEIIVDCIDRWTDRCLKDGHVHTDLFAHCGSLTMNIIGLLGFDYDFDQRSDASFKEALEDFNFNATVLMMIPWIPRWLIRFYLQMNWKYQRSRRVIREVIEKIVEQEQSNPARDGTERPKNLIASLVSSLNEEANDEQVSSGLRREEMLDEVLVSILAGYETTSTALSWFIFYASKNPGVQQRIKEELQQHDLLATDDLASLPPLTHEKLDALAYCDCVVKEVCSSPLYIPPSRSVVPVDDVDPSSGSCRWCHNTHGLARH